MALGEQELSAIEQLAKRFASQDLAARTLARDRFPFTAWDAQAWAGTNALGLPAIALPEAYGGADQGMLAFGRALAALAAVDASVAGVVFTQALTRAQLIALGPAATARRFAALTGGAADPVLAQPLYDDPDELPQRVAATATSGGYELDGELRELACLPGAKALLCPAMLDGALALFLVPAELRGVTLGAPVATLGLRALGLADVNLSHVKVGAELRLGGDDAGAVFAREAERFRPALTALVLGVLRGSYELALSYACERHQGKQRIALHHMVQEMLAGMATTLDVGELALPRACEPEAAHAALALHEYVTLATTRGTTDGVQLLGGNGYMHDYGQEKRMRDAKQLQAVFGSSQTRRLRVLQRRLPALP